MHICACNSQQSNGALSIQIGSALFAMPVRPCLQPHKDEKHETFQKCPHFWPPLYVYKGLVQNCSIESHLVKICFVKNENLQIKFIYFSSN